MEINSLIVILSVVLLLVIFIQNVRKEYNNQNLYENLKDKWAILDKKQKSILIIKMNNGDIHKVFVTAHIYSNQRPTFTGRIISHSVSLNFFDYYDKNIDYSFVEIMKSHDCARRVLNRFKEEGVLHYMGNTINYSNVVSGKIE